MGFGLSAFPRAELRPGFALIARAMKLPSLIRRADLIVTGEGMLDRSTAMGKGAGALADLCRDLGKPCLALGGDLRDAAALRRRFVECRALTEITSLEGALAEPARWLAELAASVAEN